MKNSIILLFTAFTFITCNKKNDSACNPVMPDAESAQMAAFCTSNSINFTVDANGIYYQVIDPGSGITPNENSVITVSYSASTLDGNIIVDTTSTEPLNKFIEGWRIAITYIQKGGHIKMVIPSSLAFGCAGNSGVIAPNTPLYYDVILLNVE